MITANLFKKTLGVEEMIDKNKLIDRLHDLENLCLKEEYKSLLKSIHDLINDIHNNKLRWWDISKNERSKKIIR